MGPLTPHEFASLPREKQLKMSGYGVIETIGVAGVETHVVPFVRDPLHLDDDTAFWQTDNTPAPKVAVRVPYVVPGVNSTRKVHQAQAHETSFKWQRKTGKEKQNSSLRFR